MSSAVRQHPSGFTLIEVMLYVTLAMLLLGSLGVLVHLSNTAKAHDAVRREVEEQGRQVLERVLITTRNASSIVSPAAGVTSGTLTVATDSGNVDFALLGDSIVITEGGSPIPLTNSRVIASDFTVKNVSRDSTAGSVRVSFSLSGTTTSGTSAFVYEQTYYGSASLR